MASVFLCFFAYLSVFLFVFLSVLFVYMFVYFFLFLCVSVKQFVYLHDFVCVFFFLFSVSLFLPVFSVCAFILISIRIFEAL